MDDIARFKMFCQLRRQIRGSGDHLVVGIDIAKDKHHAFFGTAKGQTLWRRLIFTNDLTGFNRLIEQVDTLKARHALGQVVFGHGAHRQYWPLSLVSFLSQRPSSNSRLSLTALPATKTTR